MTFAINQRNLRRLSGAQLKELDATLMRILCCDSSHPNWDAMHRAAGWARHEVKRRAHGRDEFNLRAAAVAVVTDELIRSPEQRPAQ